ncbi:hypothetical protein [Amycolatopsis sp. NBC_01286]|uniref:hypothetical protein n=1 Tax=Amycolatopsis sp. NBC_01286 TaxID=2903560 RepID=UPI002E12FD40|nr:hypothetical protein OG570_28765 [Amycolatopsis sp. NBC_01286]
MAEALAADRDRRHPHGLAAPAAQTRSDRAAEVLPVLSTVAGLLPGGRYSAAIWMWSRTAVRQAEQQVIVTISIGLLPSRSSMHPVSALAAGVCRCAARTSPCSGAVSGGDVEVGPFGKAALVRFAGFDEAAGFAVGAVQSRCWSGCGLRSAVKVGELLTGGCSRGRTAVTGARAMCRTRSDG